MIHRARASIVFGAAFIAGAGAAACSNAKANAPAAEQAPADSAGGSRPVPSPPRAVRVVEVASRPVPRTVLLTGSLVPSESSDIAADVPGRVVQTLVERGDVVAKGALLARLDAGESAMAHAEASAAAAAARSQDRQARLECERVERLFEGSAISRAEYDRTKAACESSAFAARAADARAGRAARHVSDSLVRAPFGGIVAERFVSVGEYVMPGTRIATVVQRDPMRLELSVPETAVGSLAVGRSVRFSVASIPGESFSATVRFVGPVIEQRTRNLPVEATIDASDDRLRPGMFATTHLPVSDDPVAAIPEAAVGGAAASPRAFVVRDHHLEERVISLGERADGWVAVRKGLRTGERVVAAAGPELRDGLEIRIEE